jgi:hypothetical protein
MKKAMRMLAPVLLSFVVVLPGTPFLNAQIANTIRAHIDHSFVIDNTTLPPGEYSFRMVHNTDLQLMTMTSENDKTSVSFIVGTAIDDHTPRHSELIFRKYGDTEFLNKIFESGSRTGAEVTERSRDEKRFAQQGLHPTEHTEEQK